MNSRRLCISGKNSNEIYSITFPQNIINFARYDFTVFMERCVDLCKLYMKTGDYKPDEVMQIRNSIGGCHKYVEQNLRGIFEKVVIDCWIEYICRQNEIGVASLWNSFIRCKTDFEKAVFARLSEYRQNKAINQWVNILKVQEYVQRKLDFVFGVRCKTAAEAATKSNYFDLMYNVVANELGYDVKDYGVTRVYNVGRIPNSPFIMSNISREIMRNSLADIKYTDDAKNAPNLNEALSDQLAMDAFSSIKSYIPTETDNIVNTIIKSMSDVPAKVYMPCGLKAVVDLEIDALIENGSVIQRCGRCREFYLRDEEYDYDYCDRVTREGRTCLEIMSEKDRAALTGMPDMTAVNVRFDQLYKELSERVNKEITQRDFSIWYQYMLLTKENLQSGKATMEDFESFVQYSLSMSFKQPVPPAEQLSVPEKKPEPPAETDELGRTIKPFVFERIDRSQLEQQRSEPPKPKNPLFERLRQQREEQSRPTPPPVPQPMPQPAPPPIPQYQQPTPQYQPQSTRIIRGMPAANVQPYEHSFEADKSNFVTIPASEKPREMSPNEIINNPIKDDSAFDDDIKIYNTEKLFPPTREEDVKVYEPKPKQQKKKRVVQTVVEQDAPKWEAPMKVVAENPTEIITATPRAFREEAAYDAEQMKQLRAERPVLKAPESRGENARSQYISNTMQLDPIKEPPEPTMPSFEEIKAQLHKNSSIKLDSGKAVENTQEIGFSDVLKGLDRKDGFDDENIETDADGIPNTHKTRRVMEALFKQSKASPSLSLGKDEDRKV